MSLRLPPLSEAASGVPRPQVIRWCLEPCRARSTGLGPVLFPPNARTCELSIAARDQSRARRRLAAMRREEGEVILAHQDRPRAASPTTAHAALPHAGLLPLPQPAPTGNRGSAAHLLGQVLPRDPRPPHEQDPGQNLAVIDPLAPRKAMPPRHPRD